VLQRIEHDRAIFAAMLGGPDRTTLFLLAAEWRGIERVTEAVAARTGQVLCWSAGRRFPALGGRDAGPAAHHPTADADTTLRGCAMGYDRVAT
jgi:hypothetical protein